MAEHPALGPSASAALADDIRNSLIGDPENTTPFSLNMGTDTLAFAVIGTPYALYGLRLKPGASVTLKSRSLSLQSLSNDNLLIRIHVGAVSDSAGPWVDQPGSLIETKTAVSGDTITSLGKIVRSVYLTANDTLFAAITGDLNQIASGGEVWLSATPMTVNASGRAALNWTEERT